MHCHKGCENVNNEDAIRKLVYKSGLKCQRITIAGTGSTVNHNLNSSTYIFQFKTLGEKAIRTREITVELPFSRRKSKHDNQEQPCTPTPLLPREPSPLSMDSKKCFYKNNSAICLNGLNGVNCV